MDLETNGTVREARTMQLLMGVPAQYMCGRAIFWGQSAALVLAEHLPDKGSLSLTRMLGKNATSGFQ